MGRVAYLHGCAVLLCAVVCLKAWGQDEGGTLKPGHNLVLRGVPPIPASLAERVRKYADYTGLPHLGWHPTRREVLLKGLSHVGWISRVPSPGAEPRTEVHLRERGIYDFYPGPRGEYILYNRDVDGDESFTLYLYDTKSRKSVPITEAKTRNTEPVWSNGGDQLVYSTSPAGGDVPASDLAMPVFWILACF